MCDLAEVVLWTVGTIVIVTAMLWFGYRRNVKTSRETSELKARWNDGFNPHNGRAWKRFSTISNGDRGYSDDYGDIMWVPNKSDVDKNYT